MSASTRSFAFRRLTSDARKNRVLRAEALESRTLMSVSNPLLCSIASADALDRTARAAAVAAAQPIVLSDNADTAIQNGSSSYSNFGRSTAARRETLAAAADETLRLDFAYRGDQLLSL